MADFWELFQEVCCLEEEQDRDKTLGQAGRLLVVVGRHLIPSHACVAWPNVSVILPRASYLPPLTDLNDNVFRWCGAFLCPSALLCLVRRGKAALSPVSPE